MYGCTFHFSVIVEGDDNTLKRAMENIIDAQEPTSGIVMELAVLSRSFLDNSFVYSRQLYHILIVDRSVLLKHFPMDNAFPALQTANHRLFRV